MTLDANGFQQDLINPQPTVKNCLSKTCCGCFQHMRDEFDGTRPWPCYWRDHSLVDTSFSVPDKDLSGWTVAGGRLTLGNGVRGANRFSDGLMFKLRPMQPPWTIEFVSSVIVPTYKDSANADRTQCEFRVHAMGQPSFRIAKGTSSTTSSSWDLILSGHGLLAPSCAGVALTDNIYNETTIKMYMRYSLDVNRDITIDIKIDDVRPPLLTRNDGLARPYIDTLPFTVRLDTPVVYNRWLERKAFTMEIRPRFGPAEVDFIEARVQPGIL